MDTELQAAGETRGYFNLKFKNPEHFTWFLVGFASMGGLISGLDQSLISRANLYLPKDLNLSSKQNSIVNSGMPLGAVAGSILISPCNEFFGWRWAIIIVLALYTIGASLCAGGLNFPIPIVARLILGAGIGLEGGTVPIYVAETVERKIRHNLVSLC